MSLLRVLVVDDSAMRRERLCDLIESTREARVVGAAADGLEALQLLRKLAPDVVTLDIEMPRLDGFGFLRLMLAERPTPVIMVSSRDARENVFRALELGATDFIAFPEEGTNEGAAASLSQKLASMRAVRRVSFQPGTPTSSLVRYDKPPTDYRYPATLIVIGASTGGPTALTTLLATLPCVDTCAVLVAQHMPAGFTAAFAERLDQKSRFVVREAVDGERVGAGVVLVSPGNRSLEVVESDAELCARVQLPVSDDRYVPSIDRLFSSAARTYGPKVIGVVLTGMGDDGAAGAREIARAGGQIIVESEATCVVYGMPRATQLLVPDSRSAPLDRVASLLDEMASRRTT